MVDMRKYLRGAGNLGYSLLDNVIGFDDGYDTTGELLGRYIRQDPMGAARTIGGSALDSVVGAVKDPIGTITDAATGIASSAGNASQGAAAYLPEGVELKDATYEQIRDANEAFLADITNVASIVPAVKGATIAIRAADSAVGADARGLIRAVAQGDLEGVGEVLQRGRQPQSLSAKDPNDIGGVKRVPVRGYEPSEIAQLESNIGLRDEKGRAKPESIMALASQFDAFGNRLNNIKPDRKTGLTHNHPASNVRMNTPVEEQKVATRKRREAHARKTTQIKVGDMLVPAFGDRMVADTDILGFSGQTLDSPVSKFGGSGYIRDAVNDRIWASDDKVVNSLVETLERAGKAGNPRLIYASMGGQASDFATDDLMRDYMRNVDIDPKLRTLLAEKLVASKDFVDKDFSLENLVSGGNSRRNLISLLDGVEADFDALNGSNRRAIWQAIDSAEFRDAGIPMGEGRIALTDRDLLFANPFDTGLNIGSPKLGTGVQQDSKHPIYPRGILGEYDGSLEVQIPAAITLRDFFNARRGLTDGFAYTRPSGDQRSFMMSHTNLIQPADQQMIDEIGLFNEYWRMFNK
jgi:hypothetical protein